MRQIFVIGIGVGNPEHLTVQAIAALNAADVIFVLDKGSAADELAHLRDAIAARFLRNPAGCRIVHADSPMRDTAAPDYQGSVEAWHTERARVFAGLIRGELGEDQTGAFLVWGDPSLYDSTLRILDAVRAAGEVAFATRVIPGISAAQALAAAHGIALNRIGGPVVFTTGRRLKAGFPADADSVVVFLDSGEALAALPADDLHIWWGAYLGSADEVLVSGRLGEVRGEILRVRREKRAEKGWIMDVYLLRRAGTGEIRG